MMMMMVVAEAATGGRLHRTIACVESIAELAADATKGSLQLLVTVLAATSTADLKDSDSPRVIPDSDLQRNLSGRGGRDDGRGYSC